MERAKNGGRAPSLFRAAWAMVRRSGRGLLPLLIADMLLHGAFLAAVYLFLLAGQEETFLLLPRWGWGGLAAALFVFCLIPFRFYAGERLRREAGASPESDPERNHGRRYALYFRVGMIRFLRGLFWGVPFLTGLGLLFYGMEYIPSFTELGLLIQRFALLVGQEPSTDTGIYVIGGLLTVFLLLFIWGWRRDACLAFLPFREMPARELIRTAAMTRRRGRGAMLKNSLVNALLLLPALAGCLAVLISYASGNMRASGSPLMTALGVWRLIKRPLPPDVIFRLLLAALALYLPFLPLRRLRTAALIAGLLPKEE